MTTAPLAHSQSHVSEVTRATIHQMCLYWSCSHRCSQWHSVNWFPFSDLVLAWQRKFLRSITGEASSATIAALLPLVQPSLRAEPSSMAQRRRRTCIKVTRQEGAVLNRKLKMLDSGLNWSPGSRRSTSLGREYPQALAGLCTWSIYFRSCTVPYPGDL